MKKAVAGAVALALLPFAAQAQSMFTPGQSQPGVYIGAEGGLNWLLNSNNYNMDLGFAAGGVVGYDFVGPRVELEGVFRSNNGTGTANFGNIFSNTRGRIEQLGILANVLYDFAPGATITPYVGAGAGIAFVDPTINGCSLCSTQFAYQGIIGLGWNVDQNFRVNLDGRYYGTSNPGAYSNNNISVMLGLTYKFASAEAAPPPPPAAAPANAGQRHLVPGVLRLGPLGPLGPGAQHDQTGRRRLQDQGQCADHRNRSHRQVGPGRLQHGAVPASCERGQGRAGA
jgi:opacity protein-like surface antigen